MAQGNDYAPLQATPVINLGSKMDDRTSNEFLNVDPNSTSFEFVSLQNADLFNTKAVSTRLGTVDIGGGVLSATGGAAPIYSLYPSDLQGTVKGVYPQEVFLQTNSADRQGMIINFGNQGASGISTFNLYGGTIFMQDIGSLNSNGIVIEAGYDIDVQMYLAAVNGVSTTNPTQFTDYTVSQNHSIALSGNFNALYNAPDLVVVSTGNIDATPLAISNTVKVNFGGPSNYATGNNVVLTGAYATPWQQVQYNWTAPYELDVNTTYFLYIVANNTSGTSNRALQAQIVYDNYDDQINTMYAYLTTNNFTGSQFFNVLTPYDGAWPNQPTTKAWLNGEVDKYNTPSYTLVEYPTVERVEAIPISGIVGVQFNTFQTAPNNLPFPGLTQTPTGTTAISEFGAFFTMPSGVFPLNGSYMYANTFSNTNWQMFSRNNQTVNPTGYNVNYVSNAYNVISSGNILDVSLLASYTGNHTFNNPNNYQNPYTNQSRPGGDINSNLDKIQSLFSNPPMITGNGHTQILFTWQFLNVLNQPVSDYATQTVNVGGQNYYEFSSPIIFGEGRLEPGPLYIRGTGGFHIYPGSTALAGGIISIPTGNAVTSIYGYGIGSSRAEKIIYTQGKDMFAFNYQADPLEPLLLFSGATTGDNLKWNHTTYQDLLFSTQYSTSGTQQCWDQIYSGNNFSGTRGNYTQPWGLQPTFNAVLVSGIPAATGTADFINLTGQAYSVGYGLQSGQSVTIMLGTQMESGGIRASAPVTVTGTANNQYIQLTGKDIIWESGTQVNSQYFFDVVPQATYVFVTQPSDVNGNTVFPGSGTTDIFYLAQILSGKSGITALMPGENPLPNSGTWTGFGFSGTTQWTGSGAFLGNFDVATLTQQIPNITNLNQSQLDQQVPTPAFKQSLVFYDYMLGFGDPNYPSRMWYTPQVQPQIWSTDGEAAGYIEVSPDDGSPITGAAFFRDNLFVFKYNACYRYTYTQNPQIPFYRYTMSNVLGSLGFFSTVSTDYGVFFLSQFGPALVATGPPDTIGDNIVPFYNTLDHTNLTFSYGIYDRLRQQVYWSINADTQSPNNQISLVYSTALQAWNIREGASWNCAGVINDFDNFNQLYIGTTEGQIQQISVGDSDSDTIFQDVNGNELTQSISLEATTPWLNLGNSTNLKRLKSLRINCAASKQILRVDVYYDQDTENIQFTGYITMSNPVISRVTPIGGRPCRTVKFVITTVGEADQVQLNSLQIGFRDLGKRSNI